jgi:hypothetical protein
MFQKPKKFLCFFRSIFLNKRFFQFELENIGSKSQLSLQCFPGVLLSLLSKKFKHIFFQKNFHVTLKNLCFEFVVEIREKQSSEVNICFWLAFAKKLSKVANLSLKEIDFPMNNIQNRVVFCIF